MVLCCCCFCGCCCCRAVALFCCCSCCRCFNVESARRMFIACARSPVCVRIMHVFMYVIICINVHIFVCYLYEMNIVDMHANKGKSWKSCDGQHSCVFTLVCCCCCWYFSIVLNTAEAVSIHWDFRSVVVHSFVC